MADNLNAVIIESDEKISHTLALSFEAFYEVSIFKNMTEGLSYIVENNITVAFCMIRSDFAEGQKVLSFLLQISEVNPFIAKIVFNCSNTWTTEKEYFIKKHNIIAINQGYTLQNVVKTVKNDIHLGDETAKRRFSRVSWPLNVKIEGKDMSPIVENVLSISCNGAYISSDIFVPKENQELDLTISFKDFKLFTNAKVVWINNRSQKPDLPKGFATTFINIGLASQKVIDDIIKDHMVKKVLLDFETKLS